MSDLNTELLEAHARGEYRALASLYARAAQGQAADSNQAAFYLTHAYVFALEQGLPEAQDYHQQLKSWGREE